MNPIRQTQKSNQINSNPQERHFFSCPKKDKFLTKFDRKKLFLSLFPFFHDIWLLPINPIIQFDRAGLAHQLLAIN
jgi:hypothetical protein